MKHISTRKVSDNVLMQLDNLVLSGGMNEELRQKLTAAKVVADAVSSGLRAIVARANLIDLTAYVKSMSLTELFSDETTTSFSWPENTADDRLDGGIPSLTINGANRVSMRSVPRQTVEMASNSKLYPADHHLFNIDIPNRFITTAKDAAVSALVVTRPDRVQASSESSFVVGSTGATFTIVINGVALNIATASQSGAPAASIIVGSINAANVVIGAHQDGDRVYMNLRVPGVAATVNVSGNTYSVNHSGAYRIPINESHEATLTNLALTALIQSNIQPQPQDERSN